MVNPLLTVIFDLFLIGSALAIVAAMVGEAITNRPPSVGRAGARSRQSTAQVAFRSRHLGDRRSRARAVRPPRRTAPMLRL